MSKRNTLSIAGLNLSNQLRKHGTGSTLKMTIRSEEVSFEDTGTGVTASIPKRPWANGPFIYQTSYANDDRHRHACSRCFEVVLRTINKMHTIDQVWKAFEKDHPGIGKHTPKHLREVPYEDLTIEQCEEAMEWLNENCIERRLERELEHPRRDPTRIV